jgi:hypothetical protein
MLRPSGAVGVRRPDRSVSMGFAGDVAGDPLSYASPDLPLKDLERAAELAEELESIVGRMPPGSFTSETRRFASRASTGSAVQDPGMRAGDEFTDVTSAGYREQAKRVAERGGAKEYATSVEEEEADARADTLRNRVGMALMALSGVAAVGGATRLGMASSQVGASPGIGRALFNTPGARNVAANASTHADRLSRLDSALDAMPAWRAIGRDSVSMPIFVGGTSSPMVYDMVQRYQRGAKPFGSADADAAARRQTGANWGRPDPRGRQHGRIGR